MYSRTSLTVATLLLLAAFTATAQPQGGHRFQQQFQRSNPLQPQLEQNNPFQQQFQQSNPFQQQFQQGGSFQQQQLPSQLQGNFGSADILDAILANGTLSSLSDENIAAFLNNEASVNSVTGCFAGPDSCYSQGAQLLVEELKALQPGTLCLDCKPGEEERLNEVIYQMVSGLSTRYPEQWSVIFPQIFSTIVAFQQKVAQQQ